MLSQCRATNSAGEACQAQPVRTSGFCYWHDPGLAEGRQHKRAEGGANRSNKARAKKALPADPLTTEELHSWLGLVFRAVIAGKTEPGIGTAAASIARTMAELARTIDLEKRIAELERERDQRHPA